MTVPLPEHPDPYMVWIGSEKRAIAAYGAACRKEAIEECARVCSDFETDWWRHYKGRGPNGSDPRIEGMSDGAAECAAAIRALGEQP
jgi:hypothetical protein